MRIDPNQYLNNDQTDKVKQANTRVTQPQPQTSGAQGSPEVDSQDTFQLSGALGQVQRLMDQLDQTPDVRSERVAALRQQVQQGTYQPSAEQIANALISDMRGNKRG
jgi:negative regulator of flagellin synthesis FlgM